MSKSGEPTSTTDSNLDTDSRSDEGFLGRWSRRKRATTVGWREQSTKLTQAPGDQLLESALVSADESANTQSDSRPVVDDTAVDDTPPPILTDADMPAIESLGDDDDYSGFMSSGVSEALRQKALRRLFRSAQFNVLDGLNDYDDDFTNFEPLGDIITSDMRHRMEEEAKKAAEKLRNDAMASEQSVADASPLELDGRSEDERETALEASDEAQQVGEFVAGDDLGVEDGESVTTRIDAHDARPLHAAPGDESVESSVSIAISQK